MQWEPSLQPSSENTDYYSLLENKAISEKQLRNGKRIVLMMLSEYLDPIFLKTSFIRTIRFLFCLNQSELCFCHLQLKELFFLVCISVIFCST